MLRIRLKYIVFSVAVCTAVEIQAGDALSREMAARIPVTGTTAAQDDIRNVLTSGVAFLLGLAKADTDSGFFVPPTQTLRPSATHEVEVRYRWATREVPVFEYETFMSAERNRYGDLVQVPRRRPVKQTGTREERYLVRDDKGDVVKKQTIVTARDKEDRIGPRYFIQGTLGQNAICLYAVLLSGVPSDTDPVPQTVNSLSSYLTEFGLPDYTFDLAWLIVAFANLPQRTPELETLTQRLCSKLLLSQITEGKGRGMWGPVSDCPDVVAAMMIHERDVLSKSIAKVKASLRVDPSNRAAERRVREMDESVQVFVDQYKSYTQILNQQNPNANYVDVGDPDDVLHWVRVGGVSHCAYGETIADLESTTLVLLALGEAARQELVPNRTIVPQDENGKDLVRPTSARAIIAAGLRAVRGLARADGAWDEGNACSVIHTFDRLGFVGLPVAARDILTLSTRATLLSTLQGYAAALSARSFEGGSVPVREIQRAGHMLTEKVPSYLGGELSIDERYNPYHMALLLALSPLPSPSLSTAFSEFLLSHRNTTDAAWGKQGAPNFSYASSGLDAFMRAAEERWFKRFNQSDPVGWPSLTDQLSKQLQLYLHVHYAVRLNEAPYQTAAAVAFLSGAMDAPAAAVWPWNERADADSIVLRLLGEMNASFPRDKPLFRTVLDAGLSDLTPDIPALFVMGAGPVSLTRECVGHLRDYLIAGGLLLTAGVSEAGQTFLDGLQAAVLAALDGLSAEPFSVAAGSAKVPCLVRKDGSIAVVFVSVATGAVPPSTARTTFSAPAALHLLSEALTQRLGPEILAGRPTVDFGRLHELLQPALEPGDKK